MRDITALHGGVRMVRLSIYDSLGGVPLGAVLDGKAALNANALSALIDERTLG
jgi:hypothetical protein